MKKFIACLKQWSEDYNAAQKELSEMGLFTAYHQWGSYVHYTDPKLSTHINNTDDRQYTIPTKN